MDSKSPVLNEFSTFSIFEKSLSCAYLCQLSYGKVSVDSWSTKMGFTFVIDGIDSNIQFIMCYTDHHQFLVIRGTDINNGFKETMKDIRVSLEILPKKYHSGVAHKGYYNSGVSLLKYIKDIGLLKPDLELVITGHSLGGAIAKIISAYYPENLCFTFGAPQVSRNFISNSLFQFNFVTQHDVIPQYPSVIYMDDGYNTLLLPNGTLNHDYKVPRGFLYPLFKLIVKRLKGTDTNIFDDHNILTYILHLNRFV